MAALANNASADNSRFTRAQGRAYKGLEHDGGKGKRGPYFFVQMADTQFGMMKGQYGLQCKRSRGLTAVVFSSRPSHFASFLPLSRSSRLVSSRLISSSRRHGPRQGCATSEDSCTTQPWAWWTCPCPS